MYPETEPRSTILAGGSDIVIGNCRELLSTFYCNFCYKQTVSICTNGLCFKQTVRNCRFSSGVPRKSEWRGTNYQKLTGNEIHWERIPPLWIPLGKKKFGIKIFDDGANQGWRQEFFRVDTGRKNLTFFQKFFHRRRRRKFFKISAIFIHFQGNF